MASVVEILDCGHLSVTPVVYHVTYEDIVWAVKQV